MLAFTLAVVSYILLDEWVDDFLIGRISEDIEDTDSIFIFRLSLTDFTNSDFENHGFVVTNLFSVKILVALHFQAEIH